MIHHEAGNPPYGIGSLLACDLDGDVRKIVNVGQLGFIDRHRLGRSGCNRELIGQAMVNLLENAVKYAKPLAGPAGRITVGLRQADSRVIIGADNGPGIPPEDRKRVLERFVRLDMSRTEAGSGLGLSLVDAVTRLHGGTFTIEDNAPGVRAVMDLPGA